MRTLAALFVATAVWTGGREVSAAAAVVEIPFKGNDKILISVPEATVVVQSAPAKALTLRLSERAAEEYSLNTVSGQIRIEPKEPLSKEKFARPISGNKRTIEIQGPSLPLEVHLLEGQIQLSKWSREALLHVQKGRIVSREGSGSLSVHSQTGEIQISDHQGPVNVDTYKASLAIRNLTGDADVENFAGETLLDKARGFLSLSQGPGNGKVLGSGGTLQFEVTKGLLNVQAFQGRVEGQTQEGPINLTLAPEGEVNIRSQSARVSVQAPPQSGASLNLTSAEGEIVAPNYLRVNRDGSQKTLRGRLKGESMKGSVVIRSQEGSIVIR